MEEKAVSYSPYDGTSFFASCVDCWDEMTVQERVDLYVRESARLNKIWGGYGTSASMEEAVRRASAEKAL